MMGEDDKRLDFDTPLLSVRRFSTPVAGSSSSIRAEEGDAAAAVAAKAAAPPPRRASLPFYKSGLKSGPVGKPGIVPFVWEQSPGRPKDGPTPVSVRTRPPERPPVAPKPPPGRIHIEKEPDRVTAAPDAVSHIQEPAKPSVDESSRVELRKPNEEQQHQMNPVSRGKCADEEEKEEEVFADARDTLSRTESFFMNCSVSGMTGFHDAAAEAGEPSGSFSTDPQVRDFMMGRFLPAAQAMATSSPQTSTRRQIATAKETTRAADRRENGSYRPRAPLSYQLRSNFIENYAHDPVERDSYDDDEEGVDDDDDGDSCYDTSHFPSKGCGLLPRFLQKSSLCLLNPLPGMKHRGRLPLPPGRRVTGQDLKTSQNGSVGQAEDEHSWEEVYKHKLGHEYQLHLKDGSKLTSEFNQLTYWSDSPTPDRSSYRRSTGGGISPYRKEAMQSPFPEGKGFLGVPKSESRGSKTDGSETFERDGESYWDATPNNGSLAGSGPLNPEVVKNLYTDSKLMAETPDSKSSSKRRTSYVQGAMNSGSNISDAGGESKMADENVIWETSQDNVSQPNYLEVVEFSLPLDTKKSYEEINGSNGFSPNDNHEGFLSLSGGEQEKRDASPLEAILPPPLPKSPSESWLWRTLPSVSMKNPPQHSFLGINSHPRKQDLQASSVDLKQETVVTSKPQHRQIRFAEVLTKTIFPPSEI